MPILLRRVVSRIQHPRTSNFQEEHARSENVTSGEGGEANRGGGRGGGLEKDFLFEVEGLDLVKGGEHFGFGEEILVGTGGATEGGKG
jgi:hypothetical protein